MFRTSYKPFLRFVTEADQGGGGNSDVAAAASADAAAAAADAATDAATAAATAADAEASAADADDKPLGPAGQKALDAMKQRARDAEKLARERDAELAALKAAAEGKQKEHEAALAAQKVKDEAIAAANSRILQAEVRALAAPKLADAEDALRFLKLEDFDVTDTGDVDRAAITAAIDQLITSKPYLAAQGGGRFQGAGDGGARNAQKPSQISDAELAQMTPEQINKARRDGRLDRLMGRTA